PSNAFGVDERAVEHSMHELALAPFRQRVFAACVDLPRVEEPPATRIIERLLDRGQNLHDGDARFPAGESEGGELALDARALGADAFARPVLEPVVRNLPQDPMSERSDLPRAFAHPVELDDLAFASRERLAGARYAFRRRRR